MLPPKFQFNVKRLPLAINAALFGLAIATSTLPFTVNAQQEKLASTANVQHFSIAARQLDRAINQFALNAGIEISVDASLTQGKKSHTLQGKYSVEHALKVLLKNTGLSAHKQNNGSYNISASSKVSATLALTTIDTMSANTTEGTGSYTTSSMNTATKLALSIRETPQAVTVLTRQRMDDLDMVDLLDVAENTPGLSVDLSRGVGVPKFYSRGFTIDKITQDGISNDFISFIPSPLSNLVMFDRVEVVRGSSGLAQGAGNPSAAINLMRKRPTDDFQGQVSGSFGSWDDVGATIDISGPLSDSGIFSGRIVGDIQDSENFRDHEQEDRQFVYATVDINLSPNTLLNLGYSKLNSFTNMVYGGMPVSATGEHLNLPRSTFVGADWEYIKQDVDTLYVNAEHQFNTDWHLSFNAMSTDTTSNFLGTFLVDAEGEGYGHVYWASNKNTKQKAADLLLTGSIEAFGRSHELVFGTSITKEESEWESFFDSWDTTMTLGVDPANWSPNSIAKPSLAKNSPDRYTYERTFSQKSAYGTARLNLTDSLKLISGVRLDWYEAKERGLKEDANPTLYGGLIYDLSVHLSTYVSYTDIFKPQSEIDVNGQLLKPIVGENYELGLKGEYFDGALNAGVAIFRINQANRAQDLADQSSCPTAPDTECAEASGLIRSEGFDLEVQGAITDAWQVSAGYTYSHVEYVEDSNPDNIGERFNTLIPEHLFKLNTTYRLPAGLNNWRIGANIHYQSKMYADISDSIRNQQSAYTLTGVMVGYEPTDKLSLQLRVNNVFDKTYYTSIGDDVYWGSTEKYGAPRNFMLSMNYSL